MGKTVVSLFDMTGNAVRPWASRGYTCYCFDIQNDGHIETVGSGSIHYVYWDATAKIAETFIHQVVESPAFLFAWPPCTDLAISGSRHFAAKKAADPHYREKAMANVYLAARVGDRYGCPYLIENPVSVISTEWRQPDFKWQPYEYGGYLPVNDVHPVWPEYYPPQDAYPKKTCLWTGGGFTLPPKKPVEVPPGYATQYQKLGGKSARTKNIRSATPRGFAEALAQAYA